MIRSKPPFPVHLSHHRQVALENTRGRPIIGRPINRADYLTFFHNRHRPMPEHIKPIIKQAHLRAAQCCCCCGTRVTPPLVCQSNLPFCREKPVGLNSSLSKPYLFNWLDMKCSDVISSVFGNGEFLSVGDVSCVRGGAALTDTLLQRRHTHTHRASALSNYGGEN